MQGNVNDELTGLAGIRKFRDRARELLESENMPWDDGTAVVIYLNIENFKAFNSKYGFEKGNELLQNFSGVLQEVFFGRLVSRFAEDHFYVLTEREYAEERIDRASDALKLMGRGMTLELRSGIYEITDFSEDVIHACDMAKVAGDSIRKKGGIHWRFFDEELKEQFALQQYIIGNIDRAIESGFIKVFYQPVVRTLTGEICGMEALARWEDPTHGLLPPSVFISVLEEYHLIHKLDAFVVKKICLHYKHCVQRGNKLVPVSFNLSRLDFELCDIFQLINKAVYENKVPKNMIHIEITESVFSQNEEFMKAQVDHFHREGYQVWMDDFGSAYSSLNVLKNYDFDELKIDMKFLSDFNERSKTVLVSIVQMAKSLGIQTLAEGVETKEQMDFLKSIGCEKVQGFYYGCPMKYWDLMRHISEKGLFIEEPGDSKYFDDIGKTDILGTTPVVDDRNGTDVNARGMALAIVERRNDAFHVMNCNESFRRIMYRIGFGEITEAERAFSNPDGALYRSFSTLFEKSERTGAQELYDIVWKGFYCSGKAKFLSKGRESSAVLISLVNLSDDPSFIQKEQMERSGRTMFALYRAVMLIDIPNDRHTVLYQSYKYSSEFGMNSAKDDLARFANEDIYRDDKKRFEAFCDLETLISRIRASGTNYISECFRTRLMDGNYEWSEYGAIIEDEVRKKCIVYIKGINKADIERLEKTPSERNISHPREEITPELLWNNALESSGLCFFWKDKNRKFLGASKAFMNYYGFNSIDEIAGKNDEEMGWHINPERFQNDEEMVLETGQKVKHVPGRCVAGGRIRDIVASKDPIYKDGKIVGLMGYFVDVSKKRAEENRLKLLSYSDELTGTMNMRGLMDSGLRYVESYDLRDMDFSMIIIDIMDFHRLNGIYGYEWGNMCLKQAADKILECIGVRGITSRPGGARFIVLYQFSERSEVEALEHDLRNSIESIRMIGDMTCTLYTVIGSAVYSECESIEILHQKAMDVMLTKKKNMDS